MLYRLIKLLMTVALRLYYRRIYVTGLENIAEKGPAIIIPNHNSSLMDAAILGVLIKRPLHFFARGDVFTNSFVSKLLAKFHMLPVHQHEGRQSLGNNADAFSEAEDILLKGGIIIFFPEGSSHIDKQLKPLRKGVFRLAFNTTARVNYSLNIPLIPAGITYSNPVKWRADVMVHLGTPIMLCDYVPDYKTNAAATLLQMSKLAYKAMDLQVPNITNADLNDLTVTCTEIAANDFYHPATHWIQATRKRLEIEKKVCNSISRNKESFISETSVLKTRYVEMLTSKKLDDATICSRFRFSGWNRLFLFSGWIIFPAGFLLNAFPILLARKISVKKVFREDFFSWIFVVMSLVLYLLWIFLLVVITSFTTFKLAAIVVIVIPVLGLLALAYVRTWTKWRQFEILKSVKKTKPGFLNELLDLRARLSNACSSDPV